MKHSGTLAAVLVVSCSSTQDVALLDSPDLVSRNHPVITSVTTDDGFTQVRQDATATLVIKGKQLQRTTSVTVGDLTIVSLDSVKAREVRVTVATTSEMTLGPADVTVISANGTTVAPGAIALTPFVVSPTGAGGHGTFQSPMGLCDADLALAPNGLSTVLLLAGTHRCGHAVFLQAKTVAGDPDHLTIVTGTDDGGFAIIAGALSGPMTIRDLTFAPPLAEWSIGGGDLDVQRVVDAGGINVGDGSFAKIDHYTYEGEGNGIDVFSAEITNSAIHHCSEGNGIVGHPGSNFASLRVDQTIVEDCNYGILLIGSQSFGGLVAEISNSQLLDNSIGLAANNVASTIVHNTAIRGNDATARVSSFGIAVGNGSTSLVDVEIAGQTDTGLSVSHSPSDGGAANVNANGLHITGGRVGIGFTGIDNQLVVRNSIIRDQTVASLSTDSLDGQTDFGTPSDPGNNQLSVISGFVINDIRFTESLFSRYVRAFGTTLNGVNFDGQTIDGPAELAPFYRIISGDSGLQF